MVKIIKSNFNDDSYQDNKEAMVPASVLVLDLVKHSTRSKKSTNIIQSELKCILNNCINNLKVSEYFFKYTGDGYIVTFYNNDSSSIIDFLALFINYFYSICKEYDQLYRIGLDFGFINISYNNLTTDIEYFDEPIIRAARLEQNAKPNQILCTDTFRDLFKTSHSHLFSDNSFIVNTKDRDITTYTINVSSSNDLKSFIKNMIYGLQEPINLEKHGMIKILIVDDEPDITDFIGTFFELKGYSVTVANSGQNALELLREDDFDIITLDIRMPYMDGMETLKRIRQVLPDIPVIMVTAVQEINVAREALKLGVFDYITKPVDLEYLETSILVKSHDIITSRDNYLHINDYIDLKITISSISHLYRGIINKTITPNNVLHKLIKHNIHKYINNFIDSINPSRNLLNSAVATKNYLDKTLKLLNATSSFDGNSLYDFNKFIKDYISDSESLNDDIAFELTTNYNNKKTYISKNINTLLFILIEIIENSLESIDDNGIIKINITALKTKDIINIKITDNGCGIDDISISKIYTENYSTKGDSRGMGLTLVKELAKSMSGQISIVSNPNKGTTTKITMPL